MTRYFEILLSEISAYKRDPNISPVNLMMYALDFANSEDRPNTQLLRQLAYIERNSTKELQMPLAVMEFIFAKNKHNPTTSKLITYKTNTGLHKTIMLSQLIKERQEVLGNISLVITKIARDYDINVKVKNKGNNNDDGLPELRS